MTTPRHDGPDLTPADQLRLGTQLVRVQTLMGDGRWRTLAQIAATVGGSEAGVSARLRDLRKDKFGAHCVERHRTHSGGLWHYRLVPTPTEPTR